MDAAETLGDSATESVTQKTARSGFTASNMFVFVQTHGLSSGVDIFLRLNGANSALTVNIPQSTTGVFEDTTNTVSVVAADLYNYFIDHGGGAGTMAATIIGFQAAPTDTVVDLIGGKLNILLRM